MKDIDYLGKALIVQVLVKQSQYINRLEEILDQQFDHIIDDDLLALRTEKETLAQKLLDSKILAPTEIDKYAPTPGLLYDTLKQNQERLKIYADWDYGN